MDWFFFLIVFFLIIFLFIALSVAIFLLLRRTDEEPINNPVVPDVEDYSKLIDITDFSCCVVNGQVVDQVFIPEFGALVSAVPKVANIACLGNTVLGFEQCEALVLPNREGMVASPVAKKNATSGLKLYYVSRTSLGCEQGPIC
jgi:hypothetical protein